MSESIQALCQHYASQRGAAPFTTAQCFDQMKNVEDMSQISDALGRLYRNGTLARRKIDNVRNEYVWAKFADNSFEVVPRPRQAAPEPAETGPEPRPASASQVKRIEAQSGSAPLPEIPAFLRKNAPSPQPSPARGEGATGSPLDKGGQGGFSSADIADAMIEKLKPLLNSQRLSFATDMAPVVRAMLANLHMDTADAMRAQSSRITLKIERVEITVEGL